MKISIIVPVYNTEKYIRKCVDSLINQTYKNLEIILIHTDSGDGSGKICDRYAKRDGRVKVIHNKNISASGARNIGLSVATGDYILFVDSDDWMDVRCCEEVLEKGLEHQADIVIFDFYKNIGKRQSEEHIFIPEFLEWGEDGIGELQLNLLTGKFNPQFNGSKGNDLTAVWGRLFRRSIIIDKVFFHEVERAEDLLFDLEAFSNASKIIYVQKNYYHYRIIKTSTSWRYHESDDYSKFNKVWEEFIELNKSRDMRFRDGLEMSKAGQMTGILQGTVFHPDNPDTWHGKMRKYHALRKEYLPSIQYVLGHGLEGKPRKYLLWAVRHNCFALSYLLCMLKRRSMFR